MSHELRKRHKLIVYSRATTIDTSYITQTATSVVTTVSKYEVPKSGISNNWTVLSVLCDHLRWCYHYKCLRVPYV